VKVPILAYHSYQSGSPRDIMALEEHLDVIHSQGFSVMPLRKIVSCIVSGSAIPDRVVGLSCDDGKQFDYRVEPTLGKSMFTVLKAFKRRYRYRQRGTHLSCFVIADPDARVQIGLGDADLLNANWWSVAARTGLMSIENHSLNHAHERVLIADGLRRYRNDFRVVDSIDQADSQIAVAARMIDHYVGHDRCQLFAYPFGHYNEFLTAEYFPRFGDRHGMLAAFSTCAEPITMASNRWCLPRYVVNCDIRDAADLICVLNDCGKRAS
jgi:hypothetical protein